MPRSHTLSKHAEDASKAQKRNSRRTSYTGAEGERDYTQRHPITRKSSTRDETRKSVNRKDSGCRCTLALSSTIPTPSPPSTPTSSTVTPILAQLPPSLEQDVEADIIQTHTQNYSAHTQNRNHNTHTHNLNHNTHACSQDYGGDVSTQKHSTHAPMTTHTQQYTRSSAQIRTESCVSSHTDGVGSNTNNVVEATVEDAAHAGSTARVNTSIQRKHLSRTLEYNHERELFMKIRLLHMWASQDVRYFMQNIGTCVHDGHLIAHRCHECVTLYLTYRKILSMPFFERNENAARSVVVNCFLGFADACGSTCVTSKARQRLMKRVDNGISGCLARVVRTSAEVEYTESLRNWYSIVHTQTDASPLHAHVAKTHPTLHQRHKHHGSHKGRHEDEHGYRRRIFFDLLDIVTLDLSETGASGLIGILYQSGGDVDKLPPLYLAIVKSMRQTVADSFYNLRCERERSKAQRRYAKMPWKTLITITKYSGKRLSSVLLHIVFRLSFGGDTLLSLWIEWVLGVQDLEEELNHIREYSGIDPRILRKCGDIVEKHYPFNAEKFSSRQNLSDLLISSLGEPSLDCEFVDGLSEQSLGSIYAYLNLLVDFKDGTDVRKKLLDDKRVIRFATEMLGFAEALFIDLIVHGNMCVFLTELHDLLKPLLKGDHVNCKGERLEGFSYMCETAADKLLRSVFKFIHSAVINGKQVQRVLVWVLDSFSRGPVVPESCETLSERRSSSASGGSGRPKHRKSSFKKKSTGISTDNQRPAHGPNDGEVLNLEAMVEQTFPGTAQRAELEREVAEVIDFYKYSRKGGEPPKLESLEKLVTPLRQWYMSRMLTL